MKFSETSTANKFRSKSVVCIWNKLIKKIYILSIKNKNIYARKILKNVAWLFFERGWIILVSILISALLARSLGVEKFGSFQYAISIFNIFLALTYICGAEVIVPKLVEANDKKKAELIKLAFLLRVIAALAAYVLMLIYAFLALPPESRLTLIVLGLMLLLKEPSGVVIALLQSETSNKASSVAQFLGGCAKLAFVLMLYMFGVSSAGLYAFGWLIEAIVVAVGLYIVYLGRSWNFKVLVNRQNAIELLKSGFLFWIAIVAMYSFQRMDRILLNTISTPIDLGLYMAAIQITENINLLASILIISIAPTYIYSNTSLSSVKKRVKELACALTVLGFLAAITLALLAGPLITVIYGEKFVEAKFMLQVASITCILFFLDVSLTTFFIKYSMGKVIIKKWILAIIACIFFGLIFINIFGAVGVLAGVVAGYIVAIGYMAYIISKKTIEIPE